MPIFLDFRLIFRPEGEEMFLRRLIPLKIQNLVSRHMMICFRFLNVVKTRKYQSTIFKYVLVDGFCRRDEMIGLRSFAMFLQLNVHMRKLLADGEFVDIHILPELLK